MDFHLIPMKRSRKKPHEGDVFVVQPLEGVYYFGKVINSKLINMDNMFLEGMPMIYIYQAHTNEITIPDDFGEILVAPIVTNFKPWSLGYLQTIGNIPVTDEEKNLDCGFIEYPINDFKKEKPSYRDIHGNRISSKPKYCTLFGLASYSGINYEICKALGLER